jgi:hypothetical protein
MRLTNQELDSEIRYLNTDDERLSVRGQALLDLRDERFDATKLGSKLRRIERERDNACRSSADMTKAYLRLQEIMQKLEHDLGNVNNDYFDRVETARLVLRETLKKEGGKIAT